MNNEITHKLWEDYPEIFPKNERGYRVGFGCDDGWYNHINALCATIMLFCKDHGDSVPLASQVKEKYGGLRFYVQSATVELYDLIERFELEAEYVCEVCGERGKIRNVNNWYKALCDKHYYERRDNG